MHAPRRPPRAVLPRFPLARIAHRAPGADRVFRPRAIVATVLLALGVNATGPALAAAIAADTPPTQPAGLRASLYGGSGGELFWQRSTDDRGVRGYEITLNGRNLGIRDALSYYDGSLKSGTRYDFTVAAVDTSGQRSAVARVSLGAAPTAPAQPAAPTVPAPTSPAAPDTPVAPVGGAPAAPAGLTAKVYSSSAAELFWTRPSTTGLRYEVRRDGAVLKTTDGVSHYESGLAGGRAYAYEIVAIDKDGKRSVPARLSLNTTGTVVTVPSTPTPTPVVVPTAGAPAAPAGLRASVYSSTAAELAWTRPSVPGLRYEIGSGGQVVASTDGVSYYTNALAGGRSYAFDVVAIDRDGRRSAPASILFDTQGGGSKAPAAPATPAVPSAPSAPAGTVPTPGAATIAVYSDTAIGLRWNPAPASARIVTTDVIRDGVSIGMANGNTWFDDRRDANTAHVYRLVAIDANGARSAPTTVGTVERAKLVSGAKGASSYDLDRLALSGRTAVIGFPGSLPTDTGYGPYYTGAAYVHERAANGTWRETQRLDSTDLDASSETFGNAVAFDGRTLVVGEPDMRRTHVYERGQDGRWSRRQLLARSGQAFGDYGLALAVDGNTLMVMANDKAPLVGSADPNDFTFVQSIDVHTRGANGTWQRVQRLDPAPVTDRGILEFGDRMALDGDTLIVRTFKGVIRFARGADGRWSRKETLVPAVAPAPGNVDPAYFDGAIALDGDTLALGSSNADAVAVFTRGGNGAWRESQRLKIGFRGGDTGVIDGGAYYYGAFTSVALADDRLYVGVAADDGLARRSGGVYVFERGANGQWARTGERLLGSDAINGTKLGWAVVADGDLVLAGAKERGMPIHGQETYGRPAAYAFEVQGN